MTDRVFVANLTLDAIVGIHPRERTTPQPVQISFELDTDISAAARSDDIASALDYEAACRSVMALVEDSRFRLVETLAERIAELLLHESGATAVLVEVRKPHALPHADAAGVRIRRVRSGLRAGPGSG